MLRQYKVLHVLGAGGFGVTYLAKDETLDKLFAIKEYFPEEFAQRKSASVRPKTGKADDFMWGKERFLDEARLLAKFHHPNIVGVTQIFEANNTAYIVLEYQSGRSFKEWLDEIGDVPTQEELDFVVKPILDALEVIHRNDLLHRDIAPDNIYIRDDGTPVLLDFGSAREAIAQRTKTISAVVKSGYSPQEQYSTRGRGQGPWSDIYAFAATLYRAVTGVAPEEATERLLSDELIPAEQARRREYRFTFLNALDWGLKLAPKDRPQCVADWRAALFTNDPIQIAAANETSATTNAPAEESDNQLPPALQSIPPTRSRRWIAATLGFVAVVAAATGVYALVTNKRNQQEQDVRAAEQERAVSAGNGKRRSSSCVRTRLPDLLLRPCSARGDQLSHRQRRRRASQELHSRLQSLRI